MFTQKRQLPEPSVDCDDAVTLPDRLGMGIFKLTEAAPACAGHENAVVVIDPSPSGRLSVESLQFDVLLSMSLIAPNEALIACSRACNECVFAGADYIIGYCFEYMCICIRYSLPIFCGYVRSCHNCRRSNPRATCLSPSP